MVHARSLRALALAVLILPLSGCYFGNKEVDPPGTGAPAGYYETVPTSMNMCATLPAPAGQTGTVTNCPVEAVTHMDPFISYIFTDPVDLQFNSSTGGYNFVPNPEAEPNPQGIDSIPVLTDNVGDLNLPTQPIASFSPMANSHPGCQVTLSVAENGTYTGSGPFNSGTDLPLLGRIAMSLTWTYAFANASGSNDCSYLSSCYAGTGCTAADQQDVEVFFYNFVQTNILTAAQLSSVIQLQYQVSFQ